MSKKFLKITDKSCTDLSGDRHHEIMVGENMKTIVFKHGEEKHLPFEEGVKFAGKDGFIVEDSDGLPLNVGVAADTVRHELAEDEVVAKLTELTVYSLKLRAAAKKGGEIFLQAGDEDRADLIAFILGKPPATPAVTEPVNPPKSDDDLGEVDTLNYGGNVTDINTVAGGLEDVQTTVDDGEKTEDDLGDIGGEGDATDAPKTDDAQA